MMIKPGQIGTEAEMQRLWVHEVSRVFHDRLNTEEDRLWFYELENELLGRYFRTTLDKNLLMAGSQTILFGDHLNLDNEVRLYQQITDLKLL